MSNEVISFNYVPDYVEFHGAIEGAIYSKRMSCPNTDIKINIIPVNNLTHEEIPALQSIVKTFDNIDIFSLDDDEERYLSDVFNSMIYKKYTSDIPLHKILNIPHSFHGLNRNRDRISSALDDFHKHYTEFSKKKNSLKDINFDDYQSNIKGFFHLYADMLLLIKIASNPKHIVRKKMKALNCDYLAFSDKGNLIDFNSFALKKEYFPFNLNMARKHLIKIVDLVSTFHTESSSIRQQRRLESYLLKGSEIVTSIKKTIAKIAMTPSSNTYQSNNVLNLFVCFPRGNNNDHIVYKNILEDDELMGILQNYDITNIRTMYTPNSPTNFSYNNDFVRNTANIVMPFLQYTCKINNELNKYNATHGFLNEFFDRMSSFLEDYGYPPVSLLKIRPIELSRIFSIEYKSIHSSFNYTKEPAQNELNRLQKIKDYIVYDKGCIDNVSDLMYMVSVITKHLGECLDVAASRANPNSLYCFKLLLEFADCETSSINVCKNMMLSCFEEMIENSKHDLQYYVKLFKQVFSSILTLDSSQCLECIEKYFSSYIYTGIVDINVYANTGKDSRFSKKFIKHQIDVFGQQITISDLKYAGGKTALYIDELESRLRNPNKNDRLRSSVRKFYDNEKENDMLLFPVYQNGIHKPLAALAAIPAVQRFLIRNKEGRPEYISAEGKYCTNIKHDEYSNKLSYTSSITLKDQLINELNNCYEPKTVKLGTDIVAYRENIESTYTNMISNLVFK